MRYHQKKKMLTNKPYPIRHDLFDKNMASQQTRYLTEFTSFVSRYKSRPFMIANELSDRFENIWIWSDQHFGHANIIKYSNRPFKDTDEMNEKMLYNHNSVVKEKDCVIWVGDVAFKSTEWTNNFLHRFVPAYRILVVGNHDYEKRKGFKQLAFDEVHAHYQIDNAWITHYPMNRIPCGVFNIHGHIHTSKTNNPRHFNVSVEQLNYAPMPYHHIRHLIPPSSLLLDENDSTYDLPLDNQRHRDNNL